MPKKSVSLKYLSICFSINFSLYTISISALMDHCISTVINKGIAVSQFFETQMETKVIN